MDFENNLWDLADQDLTVWLDKNSHEISFPHSDILKSTYLAFRQKQFERTSQICKKAFNYFIEKVNLKDDKFLEKWIDVQEFPLLHEPSKEYEYGDDRPRFRKRASRYWEKQAKEENELIIKGLISGDEQIFNDLYEFEFPKTVRLVIKNSGNLDAARDIFQDALIVLIEKAFYNKLNLTSSISGYLHSICRNLWMDQLSQNKKSLPLNDSFDYSKEDITIAGFEGVPDIYENVNAAIQSLGDPCKQLLECFYYKNMSWDEIASSLGYANAASARNQKYKCLERVRKMVNVEVE